MEAAARKQFEQILPRGVAVGTGCVIDTMGNTSRQIDLILYERDICPVFRVNDEPKTTYYPCEGVIAVGEIKSTIGKNKLRDSFEKIESVKSLKRNYDEPKHPDFKGRRVLSHRKYGQMTSGSIIDMGFDPGTDEWSDIFGFILADNMEVGLDTMRGHYSALIDEFDDAVCPNIGVFLEGVMFSPGKLANRQFNATLSVRTGNYISYGETSDPFPKLLAWIYTAYHSGKTAETVVFRKYLQTVSNPADVQRSGYFPIKDR